jgi:GAF domain-containing protein
MADEGGPEAVRAGIENVNRVLRTQRSLPAKLEAIAAILERSVPDCDAVSIGLVVRGEIGTGAASSDLAIEADLAQYQNEEGPCLDAVVDRRSVRIDVMHEDERFSHFATGAVALGVESSLSIPLDVGGQVVGSVNLYSRTAHAFSDGIEAANRTVLDYAAETIATSPLYAYSLDLIEEIVHQEEHRRDIATATGILMGVNDCSEATALTLLRRAADESTDGLVDAARRIIAATVSGSLSDARADQARPHEA